MSISLSMSLIQGYSSESEAEDKIELPVEDEPVEAVEDVLKTATFHLNENEFRILRTKKRLSKAEVKALKKRRKGPWDESDEEQRFIPLEEGKDGEANGSNLELESNSDFVAEPTTEFHGSNTLDYAGRTYMHVPHDVDVKLTRSPGSETFFAPKKVIHTFKGHEKGVTKVEFFPQSGHLLLSAGNDGNVFLWDVYHKRELLRSFSGHLMGVKDISFNRDGTKFLSCGFDKKVLIWNTETGEILHQIHASSLPNAVRFHPDNDNEFIVGLGSHLIEHYDMTAVQNPVQTYDHHLAAINTLLIVENGFLSTSVDKSVRVWEWGINIPVKVISEPTQHSMPCAANYPNGKYIALQSMENAIRVVQGSGKFRFAGKTFRGHNVAGYGIGLDVSADGRIIMSGDSKGYGFFWDWDSGRLVRKIKVSSKVVSCIAAHPQESSKVAIAGADSNIYYLD